MSELLDFPTCYVCRSVELEIVINEDFGPMTTCGECGYSWISKYEELETPLLITKASWEKNSNLRQSLSLPSLFS